MLSAFVRLAGHIMGSGGLLVDVRSIFTASFSLFSLYLVSKLRNKGCYVEYDRFIAAVVCKHVGSGYDIHVYDT